MREHSHNFSRQRDRNNDPQCGNTKQDHWHQRGDDEGSSSRPMPKKLVPTTLVKEHVLDDVLVHENSDDGLDVDAEL